MAVTVTQILPSNNYTVSDEVLLNPSVTQSYFDPSQNYIEYTISTIDDSFTTTDYNYNNYSFPKSGVTSNNISDIIINPENDLINIGYSSGEFDVYYNFLKNELNTSFNNRSFFIKEISPDRTEITLGYTTDQITTINDVINFRNQLLSNPEYFQDFYLNFGGNILVLANNIAINNETFDVLINLYEELPLNLQVKDTLWVVTQVADELAFNIVFTPDIIVPTITTFPLRSPNFNLPVQDQLNNSTNFQTYESLITSSLLSTSYSQLNNLISSSGIQIGVDYTNFSNFIHFSSAVTRINNFYYKKQLIDQYQQEINVLNNITSFVTSSNISILTKQITNIIENFDGYEYYLYYGSGSWSYPKSGSTVPYTLYPAGSPEVRSWLGDAEELTGILGSASLYDRNNLDYLYNTIPNFIQEDPQNDPYKTFVEMVAQSYDNIWIYYKDVTNRYNADNRLDFGISKDLVANALKSFGVKLYQNNFSTNDLYSAFLGYGAINPNTTGSLPVIAGSGQEYISNYITASYDASVMPLDDVNKETYKRLYHNLPYLAKTKGTIPGLRALINCFGVPDTILRISEFGGRDKDTSTYDYFDQKYNYAYYRSGSVLNDYIRTTTRLNTKWEAKNNAPESIQFRFKPSNTFPPTQAHQSLLFITSSNISSSFITLQYTGSGYISASYSGSTYSSSFQYGTLTYFPSIGNNLSPNYSNTASLYLPFFNGDWWSIMLNRSGSTYTLYAGSKGYYDGYDGNQILYLASSSVNESIDDTPFSGSIDNINIYLPLDAASRLINVNEQLFRFEGYLQELRYWARTGSVEGFKDFIMNPSSIDYWGDETEYADYLAFRAPLGNELSTASIGINSSVHPKVTGSWETTSSFLGNSNNYLYASTNGVSFTSNIESFFYNQPIAGIKNRVTDKIQIVSSSYPTGSVLSQYRSLEQTYPTLGSETPDINLLEVAFSPQNEINNDIISSLGYFNIGEYIGDPRQVSSSATTYPDLVNLSNDFFQKYFASYNLFDYIRLIKYFDNSLFKMIQDFVPARTSLTSGVVIKQHLLERNKYPQPQVEWEDVTYSGSITTTFIDGGTGGTFDSYNFTGSTIPPTFINNTQSWGEEVKTPVGLLTISHSTQDEFYNGELPNSLIIVTDGELNEANTIKYPSDYAIIYNPVLYISDITTEATFNNPLTAPKQGEVFLWWDSGSLTNPGNTKTVVPSRQLVASLGKPAADFLVNKTNGVKYIKLNRIDSGGLDQSPYLQQLQTITLAYPDRTQVTYNIAGVQNSGDYFTYSIGPYAPGGMNNFNTSSAGDIRDYEFSYSSSITSGPLDKVPPRAIGMYSSSINIDTSFLPTTGSGITYNNLLMLGIPSKFAGVFSPTRTPNTDISINYTLYITTVGVTRDIITFVGISGSGRNNIAEYSFATFPDSTVAYPVTLNLKKTDFVSGSRYYIGVACENISTPTPNLTFYQNTDIVFTQTPLEFNGSSSLITFDPYVVNFDYNEYNTLINNAEIPQTSVFFMDVDYSQNPVIPVNQSLILDESADRAYVQDSNYTSQAWSNIRYNGSRTNSYRIISQ